MTITLELPPEVEDALAEDPRRGGTTLEQIIADNLRRQYVTPAVALPAAKKPVSAMVALFAQWAAEDPVIGPEDAAARQREGDELMTALQKNRMNLVGRTDFRDLLSDGGEHARQEAPA